MDSIACFRHPHHISLIDTKSFRNRLTHVGDPYYNIDGLRSHHGLLAPKFDVLESEEAYFLVGDVPGLSTEDGVKWEWLDHQILFLQGLIEPVGIETRPKDSTTSSKMKMLHSERRFGPFERSFTLPMQVNSSCTKVELKNGLLTITVQKK